MEFDPKSSPAMLMRSVTNSSRDELVETLNQDKQLDTIISQPRTIRAKLMGLIAAKLVMDRPADLPWREAASCLGVENDNLFVIFLGPNIKQRGAESDSQKRIDAAQTICQQCNVRPECSRMAEKMHKRDGIIGVYDGRYYNSASE